jgi:predicted RNase H-like nuclease
MRMYFVGLDLASGENNQTGVAAVDSGGRLLHVGSAHDDESIVAAIAPFVAGDCLVAIDAPLIVPNPTGSRPCEQALNADFGPFDAEARPASSDKPEFKHPRGARLATTLGLDMDPASTSNRRAIEVLPRAAGIVLFTLKTSLKYARGDFDVRQRELLRLMTFVEELDTATPRLRANRSVAWVELRRRVEAASRPGQLDRDESPVDALLCAYVALYWYDRPEDVRIYGDVASGYIVTPALPENRSPATPPPPRPKAEDDIAIRLTVAEARLAELARELADLRRRLRESEAGRDGAQ